FQAEDGIRDFHVTGVQTCALPIYFERHARGSGIKKKYWNDRGRNIVSTLEKVANSHQVSLSAVALAWLLAQESITAPIASGTKESHLQAFVEAAHLQLSSEELQELNEASSY